MTEQEIAILNRLGDLHNDYLSLPPMHQHDLPEWVNHIHSLQRIIATNQVRRDNPELFHIYKQQ